MNTKPLFAEFLGTFTLIFIGAGAGALGVGGLVGVALAHGLVVMFMAYAHGHLSGSHINPAVTFGLWSAGKIKLNTALGYWVAQLLGGILGAMALSFILGAQAGNLGATDLAVGVTPIQGLVLEAFLTFLLVNTILHTAVAGKAGNLAPVAIGMTLTACILMGGPLTGASLNPARTIGPALMTGQLGNVWVYLAGTLLGGGLAGVLHKYFINE
jgi:aquaporin Z